MDAVNAFNMEHCINGVIRNGNMVEPPPIPLFSMIEMKPPISRAKMMSVTKSAMKAIKLYKHVVQIVEKFIKKCKPELKIPGLYVVDSIVRQSRHQFGVDKDVFGPRFLKNFTETFQNIYLCPEDEKTKIVRVLNLWQKNGVFEMDTIQSLLDMANGSFVPSSSLEGSTVTQAVSQPPVISASVAAAMPRLSNPDALAAVAQLFQSPHGQELQKILQNLQQGDLGGLPTTAHSMPPHDDPYETHTDQKHSLAKKLLDRFDYDDEPEDRKHKEDRSLGGPGNDVYNQFPCHLHSTDNFHPHGMGENAGNEYDGGIMQATFSSGNDTREGSRDESMRRASRHRGYGRRSRSGSRSPRRRRSRSTSRSRRSRQQRSSGSRERRRRSPRSRSQDRSERERERERRQKGLPSIKSQTLSVCTTTLWVGQLDKKTQQSDVMSLLEEFGQIESINMIPPRGCAYIVMVHRQDAHTALSKLGSGSFKVNQKPIKIAWALNKGVKSTHKKFWDVEWGVTYIPWNKVKVEELESFREGGMLDVDSLNPEWEEALKQLSKPGGLNGALENSAQVDGPMSAPVQMPSGQHTTSMRGVPAFNSSVAMATTSIPAVAPPFVLRGFNPTKVQQGFSAAAAGSVKQAEEADSQGNNGTSPKADPDMQLGSPGTLEMNRAGPVQGPMQGPMPPLHPPPGMPMPHMPPPFLPPPHMGPMPPHMMPRGPMFPPDRFRMPMSFGPRGPPFPPQHPMGPGGIDGRDERHFPNGRPGFGGPHFHRGRW